MGHLYNAGSHPRPQPGEWQAGATLPMQHEPSLFPDTTDRPAPSKANGSLTLHCACFTPTGSFFSIYYVCTQWGSVMLGWLGGRTARTPPTHTVTAVTTTTKQSHWPCRSLLTLQPCPG